LGGDFFIFHEIFSSASYYVPPTLLRDQAIRQVIDLGAHIGLASLYLSQFFQNAGSICVEPNPNNLPLLKHNLNCLGERVQVIAGAINDIAGQLWFDQSGATWGGHLNHTRNSETTVQCYTMGDIIDWSGGGFIDILKVDVEGAAEKLFRQRNSWLERVRLIIVELHGTYNIGEFEKDVRRFGFQVLPPYSPYGNRMIIAAHA
jgi:FkbM family methyltransferase